jgi:hypothetical protein
MTTFGDRVFQSGGIPVGGGLLGLIGDGRVFFVDPGNGDDANPGTSPTSAYATMSTAIGATTTQRGDVIVRLPGTETVTAELLITTEGITVVAATSGWSPPAGRGAGAEYYLMWGAALSDAAVIHQRENCSWIGLSFASISTGATEAGAAMNIANEVAGDQGGFNYVTSCEFPAWGSNDSGIYLHGGSHAHIYRNSFGGASGTLPVGVAFGGSATSNPVNDTIEDNIFSNVTTGVRVYDGTPQDCFVIGNFFHQCTTDINSNGGVGNIFVANNASSLAAASAYDDTVANLETAGWFFSGNTYVANDNN